MELALAGYNGGPYRIKKLWRQAGLEPRARQVSSRVSQVWRNQDLRQAYSDSSKTATTTEDSSSGGLPRLGSGLYFDTPYSALFSCRFGVAYILHSPISTGAILGP